MGYEDLDRSNGGNGGGCSTRILTVWVIIAKLFAILAIVLVAVWLGVYGGGFSWSKHLFNYHPLMMTIGLIYLFGDAILVFRVLPGVNRQTLKVVHLVINLLALACVVVGLHAVFSKGGNPLYSLHAWIGIVTVAAFALQWVGGLVAFLIPALSGRAKSAYKPVHIFWGVALFALAGLAAITGTVEHIESALGAASYSQYAGEGLLANAFGVVVIVTITITAYIVTNPDFKKGFKSDNSETIPIN